MKPVEQALKSDFPGINQLLQRVNLPTVDTNDCTEYFFKIENNESAIIASIGLEIYGTCGLLRSLAVDPAFRDKGLARMLVDKVEKLSADLKLKAVYLLTTTAEIYFEKKGFVRIRREEVPEEIRQSSEFSSICPSSAISMVKPV